MPWYGYVLLAVATAILVPYLGWVGLTLIGIRSRLVALESWRVSRERECAERLKWLRGMDAKLDRVAEDTAEIKGLLKARK